MANKLYIKEFESLPTISANPAQIWNEPASVEQTPIAIDGTARPSAAFGPKTKLICITSDLDTSYLVGATGVAAVTGTNFPLWSKSYLAIAVQPGQFISGVLWT